MGKKIKINKAVVVRVIILIGVLSCGFFAYKFHFAQINNSVILEGEIETTIYSQNTEVAGRIIEFKAEQGQHIKKGDTIAVIDNKDQIYNIEQLEAVIIKKQATLKELRNGADNEEITQAQNNILIAEQSYESAKTALELASDSYEKIKDLSAEGAVAKNDLDVAKSVMDNANNQFISAQAQLNNRKEQLSVLKKGASDEKITIAEADLAQSEVELKRAKENLDKYTITALIDGIAINKNYELGDMVASGYNLLDIASTEKLYFITYVPVQYLEKIYYGQELTVKSGNIDYNGVVSYIALESEYTPKDLRSTANKNRSSIKIKLLMDENSGLIPGQKGKLAL